jgi:hypothetical protein
VVVGCATVTLINATTTIVVPDLTQPIKVGLRVAGHRLVRVGRVPLGRRAHPLHLRVASGA